jgi:hypothetical protein
MATEVVIPDAPSTPAELREAITHLASTAARLPIHFAEKRKIIHAQINDYLTELEFLDELQSM